MTDHPITPPSELLQLWFEQHHDYDKGINELLIEAAQYGADQELEACIEWLEQNQGRWEIPASLRTARRPKPPSLKAQALKELTWVDKHLNMPLHNHCTAIHTIRRALEQLPDNE
jgi:hypothetical protein